MNFLQLSQRLAVEAGVPNANGTRPSAVAGQVGELGRVVGWIGDAWNNTQQKQNWSWMWENPTLNLGALASTIAGSIAPQRYDHETMWLDDGSTSGRQLDYYPWDEFRLEFRTLNGDDNLTAWTIRPDLTIAFNALASTPKTMTVERYVNPVVLAADADTPAMPADLHMLIVWRALIKYANFDEAGVQRRTAVEEYQSLRQALFERCLPQWRLGPDMLEQFDA